VPVRQLAVTRAGSNRSRRRPQVAAIDLHVAIIGQLPVPQLPFDHQFQPGPVKVVCFEAALWCHRSVDEATEHLTRHADDALVLTNFDCGFGSGLTEEERDHDTVSVGLARLGLGVACLRQQHLLARSDRAGVVVVEEAAMKRFFIVFDTDFEGIRTMRLNG